MMRIKIRSFEKGLHFRKGEFIGLLDQGTHWFRPGSKSRVDVVSMREPWLVHPDLDLIIRSGQLEEQAELVDLRDDQRALVWIDGRFEQILGPGIYALWTAFRKVVVEVVNTETTRFEHRKLAAILATAGWEQMLSEVNIPDGSQGLFFVDGKLAETLEAGRYAFWRSSGVFRIFQIDLRESVLDISGQEIMTADKVTLRLNALVAYRVVDSKLAVASVEDYGQALYRECQLALRAAIGTRTLDELLVNKDSIIDELQGLAQKRAEKIGLKVATIGIRDVILPGEMRDLLNRVTEAKKAAEAALITRREETAAMRSQANTAKILEASPTLMRLRELEVLEKIAANSKLNVILGEKGLADRMVNLI